MSAKTPPLLMVFILIVCGALYTVSKYDNDALATIAPPRALNYACTTELCLTILHIMDEYDRNTMLHYSKYFDEALMHNVRAMFSRLYGFAVNEAQGIQWESLTIRYLQVLVIYISATVAITNYMDLQSYEMSTNEPASLQSLCLSQVIVEITTFMNDKFASLNVSDSFLQYELMHFANLPVMVSVLNVKPYLILQLKGNSYEARFVDETPSRRMSNANNTVGSSRQTLYALPFSPVENLVNDVEHFNRAQSGVLKIFCDFKSNASNSADLTEFVDANIVAYANEFYDNLTRTSNGIKRTSDMLLAFFQLCMDWLEKEYRHLICNPILNRYKTAESVSKSMKVLERLHKELLDVSMKFTPNKCQRLLYEELRRIQPIIGYSLQRSVGIVIVESITQKAQTSSSMEPSCTNSSRAKSSQARSSLAGPSRAVSSRAFAELT